MTEDEIRVSMRARWIDPIPTDNEPVGEIIGFKIRFPRVPDAREVTACIMFDKPLWEESIFGPTRELWTPISKLEAVT